MRRAFRVCASAPTPWRRRAGAALLALGALLLAPLPAAAFNFVDLVWVSTTGPGTPGSTVIEANNGDVLVAEVSLFVDDFLGVSGYSVSLQFDQVLDDELDLISASGVFNPVWPIPVGGNPASTTESTVSVVGNVLSFAAQCTPFCGPTFGSFVIGTVTFQVKSVATDGSDVASGLFNVGDDIVASDGFTSLAFNTFFGTATVDDAAPTAPPLLYGSRQTIASTRSGPRAVTTGDVDGDGDLDVFAAYFEGQTLAWYENRLDEISADFGPERTLTSTATGARVVKGADLDSDGDLDALAAVQYGDRVIWFENRLDEPSADFGPEQSISGPLPDGDDSISVEAADLDGDGDLDVVFSQILNDKIAWFENRLNEPSADFGSAQSIDSVIDQPVNIDVADVDGDGDPDVLATPMFENEVTWYENRLDEISADFGPEQVISSAVSLATRVRAADVDGDGDLDALSASQSDDKVAWYENLDGQGTFGPQQLIGLADGVLSLDAGDVDLDGDLDVISPVRFEDEIVWWENTAGDGSAWTPHLIFTGADDPHWVHAADLDGDGDLDALSTSFSDKTVGWYENLLIHRSADFSGEISVASILSAVDVSMADIDRDGDVDLVAGDGQGSDRIVWYDNANGDGTVWSPVVVGTEVVFPSVQIPADVDGDGDVDILTTSRDDSRFGWYENLAPGDGSIWSVFHVIPSVGNQPKEIEAADFDRDGDLDVIMVCNCGSGIQLHLNLGGGASWSSSTLPVVTSGHNDLRAGDVDGDGDSDIVVAASGALATDPIAWYENQLDVAGPWTAHIISTTDNSADVSEPADVDGDGDLDVVTAANGSGIAWHANGGDGTSWARNVVNASPPCGSDVTRMRVADLDADGDLDIAASDWDGNTSSVCQEVAWYENSAGDGSAWTRHLVTDTADNVLGIAVGDLDGDGAPDLATGHGNVFQLQSIQRYQNRGGQFSLLTVAAGAPWLFQGEKGEALSFQVVHEGRAGDDALELATVELRFDDEPGTTPLTDLQLNALVLGAAVHLDDGDAVFEALQDPQVASAGGPFSLGDTGLLTLTLGDGDTDAQVSHGTPRSYWVALELQAGAGSASPNRFQVVHRTESSSTAEHSAFDLPLSLEFLGDTNSGVIQVLSPGGDQDGDGLSDGDEVNIHGTDPTQADSDGDGMDDGAEVAQGSDPLDFDSDNDGVCDGPIKNLGQIDPCTAGPDNCPLVDNGLQTNSDALPAGDDCQCGDVNGDFVVDATDLQIAAEHLVGRAESGAFVAKRCNVVGPSDGGATDCDVRDLYVLDRYVGGQAVTVENACDAWLGL